MIGTKYWLDIVNEYATLYRKDDTGENTSEIVWDGKLADAGIVTDPDPFYQDKLYQFFEKHLHIRPEEWEIG